MQILTIHSEFESVKKLGFPTFLNDNEINKEKIVLRWGKGDDFEIFDFVLNEGPSIKSNIDKESCLYLLSEVVNVPQIFAHNQPKNKLVVLKNSHHSGGLGFNISIASKKRKIPPGKYCTEFIDAIAEYRVWFCCKQTIQAQRIKENSKDSNICRSQWGYKFVRHNEHLHQQTLIAAEKIGLDVGAADILIDKDNKEYFLELNSAPTIDDDILIEFFKKNLNDNRNNNYENKNLHRYSKFDFA